MAEACLSRAYLLIRLPTEIDQPKSGIDITRRVKVQRRIDSRLQRIGPKQLVNALNFVKPFLSRAGVPSSKKTHENQIPRNPNEFQRVKNALSDSKFGKWSQWKLMRGFYAMVNKMGIGCVRLDKKELGRCFDAMIKGMKNVLAKEKRETQIAGESRASSSEKVEDQLPEAKEVTGVPHREGKQPMAPSINRSRR
ncbi:hypothetical protein JCGZ_24049 [Jatropha curcas]|uniref:Uncharacterized protein n=1 Tax=Jatropha curcas TaxID=180498 RepID=A0A067LPM5_JATCU|nr:hypothetical protein JCGZ_24049 [Jatropha curcas]